MENQIQPLINGVEYLVECTDKDQKHNLHIVFCHKDKEERFVHGVTSEGLLQVLMHRYQHLVGKSDTAENIQCLLFLRQAYDAMKQRKANKRAITNDSKGNDIPVSAGSK